MIDNYGISIHALREEGDPHGISITFGLYIISIHALREEGDTLLLDYQRFGLYFYPRPP